MLNFLDDIFLINWYGKLYIFGKPMSWYLTGRNFINIGDILVLQKENALDEYILSILTKVTYSAEVYVKTCRHIVAHSSKKVRFLFYYSVTLLNWWPAWRPYDTLLFTQPPHSHLHIQVSVGTHCTRNPYSWPKNRIQAAGVRVPLPNHTDRKKGITWNP